MFTLDEKAETILETKPLIGLHREFIKTFLKEGRFKITIEIRNLKEEAKDEDVESGVSDVSD